MDVVKDTQQWALQTIIHAMTLKGESDGKTLDPNTFTTMRAKGQETAKWFWDEAQAESKGNTPMLFARFVEKVLDFTWTHRKGLPNLPPKA